MKSAMRIEVMIWEWEAMSYLIGHASVELSLDRLLHLIEEFDELLFDGVDVPGGCHGVPVGEDGGVARYLLVRVVVRLGYDGRTVYL